MGGMGGWGIENPRVRSDMGDGGMGFLESAVTPPPPPCSTRNEVARSFILALAGMATLLAVVGGWGMGGWVLDFAAKWRTWGWGGMGYGLSA